MNEPDVRGDLITSSGTTAAASEPIAIVGAGPLGLSLALALRRRGQPSRLFDARPAGAPAVDARILALSDGSRQLLEALGAWPSAQATPIRSIHISQRGSFGRARMLAEELGLPALGYVLPAASLTECLLRRTQEAGIPIEFGTAVSATRPHDEGIEITLSPHGGAPRTWHARLLACCEGSVSAAAPAIERDYGQHALLCRAHIARPHDNVAFERFTAEGPIALLPLGQDYAVVWTVASDRVQPLLAADDAVWLQALQAAFGQRVPFTAISGRAHYPLGLRMRRQTAAARTVWLGNAAQTLHPVAGQGFNLALRDAWELADTLAGAQDPGTADLLARHARGRRIDRLGAAGFTDFLVRSFALDLPFLPTARGLGLLALDMLPPLRHFVAKRMIYGARAWP